MDLSSLDLVWRSGYLYSDAMRVIERLWRVGESLAYQVTVEDSKVLTEPDANASGQAFQ